MLCYDSKMSIPDILLPLVVVVPISLLCYREFYRLQYERDAFEKVVENRFAIQELHNTVKKLEEDLAILKSKTPVHGQMTDLQKTVSSHGAEISDLKIDLQTLKEISGSYRDRSAGDDIAFSVYPSGHLQNLGTSQLLIFDKIDYISGGGYDVLSGVYTCPVSGLYYLHLSVLYGDSSRTFYGEIVVGGKTLGISYNIGDYGAHSNIAHCSKNETILLRRYGSIGGNKLHAGKYTNFVGFLL